MTHLLLVHSSMRTCNRMMTKSLWHARIYGKPQYVCVGNQCLNSKNFIVVTNGFCKSTNGVGHDEVSQTLRQPCACLLTVDILGEVTASLWLDMVVSVSCRACTIRVSAPSNYALLYRLKSLAEVPQVSHIPSRRHHSCLDTQ